MPTYSYRCQACSHAFDIQQSFTDDALTTCPECHGALRKVFSPVGVTFQGSGFYRTDSRNEAQKPAAAKESTKGTSAAASSAPAKSNTTPAAKPAASSSSS